MRCAALTLAFASILMFSHESLAQGPDQLIGTWERFAQRNRSGRVFQPLARTVLIFSNDGYYSQIAVRRGREKTTRPLAQLTLKEMLARFEDADARYGKYNVSADTVFRTTLASLDPANTGGAPQVQLYKITGDTLILKSASASDRSEARFRRMR